MQKPLVSICLPNYNYEKFIGETIESALAQTYENFELIIVDNGSTDSSVEIIKKYDDPRIKLYQNEKNIPLYQNINKAQSLAKGELITVLHSDDLYEPTFLEEVVTTYNKYPTKKVFVTGVYIYHSEINKLNACHPFKMGGLKTKQEVLLRLVEDNNIGNGVNVAYHRSCFIEAGGFSDKYRYAADYEYWIRLANLYDFVYIPKILAKYRIHGSNLSHSVNKDMSMLEEGYEIFNNSLLKSSINIENIYPTINFIHAGSEIKKAFTMGLKYDSGELIRKRLGVFKRMCPGNEHNPYWYFVYMSSFLVQIPFNPLRNVISFVVKSAFYPYKKASEQYRNAILRKLSMEKMPKKKCSSCSSCGS